MMITHKQLESINILQDFKSEINTLLNDFEGNIIRASIGIVGLYNDMQRNPKALHSSSEFFNTELCNIKEKLNELAVKLLKIEILKIDKELSFYMSDIKIDTPDIVGY